VNLDFAKDLSRLRWSLILLAAMIVVGASLVVLVHQTATKAEAIARQLSAQLSDIRGHVASARDEQADMLGRIRRFQALGERRVIGQEERLDWVEQIARIKAARRLLDVQYEIAPQAPISATALPGGAAAGLYEIMSSTMKLHMQLLDEDDLLGFLADLRQAVHAQLLVRACKIERAQGGAGSQDMPAAQLLADCTIDWVTLREKAP
jgi:hypothetical protein